MPTDRATRLLEEFAAVTAAAPRPEPALRRNTMKSGLPGATLAGAVLIVAIVAAVGLLSNRPAPITDPGADPSPSSVPSMTPLASTQPSPSAPASPSPSPTVPPSVEPTVGPCDPATLTTRITSWEGAAGQRIANVELVNQGPSACLLETRARPQLVDGDGRTLIDGQNPATTPVLTLEPGAKVTTMVAAGNYCGPAPMPPPSVAFVVGSGGRIVATPAQGDTTWPSCLGPGQPGTIDMHPWAP